MPPTPTPTLIDILITWLFLYSSPCTANLIAHAPIPTHPQAIQEISCISLFQDDVNCNYFSVMPSMPSVYGELIPLYN